MRRDRILAGGIVASALVACTGGVGTAPDSGRGRVASAVACKPFTKVPQPANAYTLFETLQVRPIALSPNGKLLFVANTPDNRLEIFRVDHGALEAAGSVAVGLEPVAVAARSDGEVWVVNHLSDSVSVVDVSHADNARVVRTLLVGDEPRDIVFAGPKHDRAFVTTAHRGQTTGDDPELDAVNVGRADVWVFDANDTRGQRLTKLTLFSDTPRALAATPDGSRVYAAAFFSGNQTTIVSPQVALAKYGGAMPGPSTITLPPQLGGVVVPQPQTGLIVKWSAATSDWVDAYGSHYGAGEVTITLPDKDVFVIDATKPVPVPAGDFAHVGTTLFNMAVNPVSGKVYVSNTEAHNDVRFEGDPHGASRTSVRGNLVDSRISVIDPTTGSVTVADLNPHLDHAAMTGDKTLSRAFPQDLAVTRDGTKLLVVAQGSGKLAIYDTAALDAGRATPTAQNQVRLTGGGPTGVALDEADGVAFVHTRFDNGISIVRLSTGTETEHLRLFNPEPASVTAGRAFLYDATATSALGDQACASCHVGGDFDALAWDLGNPSALPLPIASNGDVFAVPEAPIEQLFAQLGPEQAANIKGLYGYFQPVKGPMETQSLRGLDNHGAMHWRGDRNGAVQQTGIPFVDANGPVVSQQPNGGMFDEVNAFKSFNVAFPGLVGGALLSEDDMAAYTDFALQITYPPNPIRNLDDSLTPDQKAGRDFFFNRLPDGTELPVDRFHSCGGCHVVDRTANAGQTPHPGFFGTDGRLSFDNESQLFKVPQLRNVYQKLGMYGSSPNSSFNLESLTPLNGGGPSTRGFGVTHDGGVAKPRQFFSAAAFVKATTVGAIAGLTLPPNPGGIPLFNDDTDPVNPASGISLAGLRLRQQVQAYVLAFDSNLFPIVGQQVTLTASNANDVARRIALLEAQAAAGACDLVVRGFVRGQDRGFVYEAGAFRPDASSPSLGDAALRALVGSATVALTFTAVPPGSGYRIGIDRDGDGYADFDERAAGSDPADARSTP